VERRRNKEDLPEGTRDSVGPSDVGRLQKGGGPCPLTDDDASCQSGLNHTASRAEEQRMLAKNG